MLDVPSENIFSTLQAQPGSFFGRLGVTFFGLQLPPLFDVVIRKFAVRPALAPINPANPVNPV